MLCCMLLLLVQCSDVIVRSCVYKRMFTLFCGEGGRKERDGGYMTINI